MIMRMLISRLFVAVAIFCCASVLGACATRTPREMPVPDTTMQFTSDAWFFRHKVHLSVPAKGLQQSFDGIIELSPAPRKATVAAIAGPGVTLFTATVTPENITTHALLPAFARIPHVQKHIALCIRRLMFDTLANAPQGVSDTVAVSQHVYEASDGTVITATVTQGRLTFAQAQGKQEHWNVSAMYGDDSTWPKQAIFHNIQENYTVTVDFLHVRQKGRE